MVNIICGKGVPDFLLMLNENNSMYVEEIGEKTGLSGAWVARTLSELSAAGIVKSQVDGRKKFISLTEKGARVAAQVRAVMVEIAKLEEIL